jgi:hypothetical protein
MAMAEATMKISRPTIDNSFFMKNLHLKVSDIYLRYVSPKRSGESIRRCLP